MGIIIAMFTSIFSQKIQPQKQNSPTMIACSGSWPDPYWTEDDYKRKAEAIKRCEELYGKENRNKTWQ